MMNRRTFLGTSAATLLASEVSWASGLVHASPASFGGFPAEHKIKAVGVQLYTVRDAMKSDFEGTLAKVAQIGYKEVEFAGYFDHSPKDISALLKKDGLTAPSCHVAYDVVENKWDQQIEAAHTIGHKFIVCPWIEPKQRQEPDGYKRAADLFQKAGEVSKKAGIQFAYHNHTFEFQPSEALGGKLPYDILLATDPNYVKMELDLCWITVAGKDPIEYFNKYPGRFPLVHVKDMKVLPKGAEGPTASPDKEMPNMTDVGSGVIDWKHIFSHDQKAGIQHYFVEHDFPSDAFASITKSYAYLSTLTF
jgi:sugar phosphate isomerase/epimerase